MLEHQIGYWGKTLKHYVEAQQALAKGEFKAPADTGPKDRRFSNPLWDSNPAFNFLKQQYLLNASAVKNAVADMESLDETDRKRVEFFTRQIVDMFAPTNFLGTNPDALEKAVATDGEISGAGVGKPCARHRGGGRQCCRSRWPTRRRLPWARISRRRPATVVFRNRMFELIQYTPTTETVYKTPLLIFPPWINKFYVLDMKPANSLIKWVVEQGFTVFVVSWVNPDASYADVTMDDYIREGFLTAMAQVRHDHRARSRSTRSAIASRARRWA